MHFVDGVEKSDGKPVPIPVVSTNSNTINVSFIRALNLNSTVVKDLVSPISRDVTSLYNALSVSVVVLMVSVADFIVKAVACGPIIEKMLEDCESPMAKETRRVTVFISTIRVSISMNIVPFRVVYVSRVSTTVGNLVDNSPSNKVDLVLSTKPEKIEKETIFVDLLVLKIEN